MKTAQKNASRSSRRQAICKFARCVTWLTLLCVSTFAFSQSYRGSIRGSVQDASGASVAGATLTARNIATGETRTANTATDGVFVLPELPAGEYELTVNSANFAAVQQ